jgi:hypothetical protein
MMPLLRAAILGGLASLAASQHTAAQSLVDQVPRERTITTAEQTEYDMQNARLQWGPMRVFPMIVVDNAGYDNNVFSRTEEEGIISDWTVTAGAGGRILLPLGKKFYLRAMAVPSYIWYDKLVDRRTWGGNYNAGFLALGNRLSFEANGTAYRDIVLLSSETQVNVVETVKSGEGKVELDITSGISFVGSVDSEQGRYLDDPQNPIGVTQYDRTDSEAVAGLRWRLTSSLDFTAGAEGARTSFVENSELRDNQSYALLGGIHFDRPKFFVNLAGGYRKGRALNNHLFDYSTTVGSYFASWFVGGPFELQAFGHRHPVYARSALDLLYIESRYGGGVKIRLGRRIRMGGEAETGTNKYIFSRKRTDDALSYGGTLSIQILDNLALNASARQTIRTPGDGTPERRVFHFWTGLTFNAEYRRE